MADFQLDQELVDSLREMARTGSRTSKIAAFFVEKLGQNRILAIAYFREAFEASIVELGPLAAWHRFPQGTVSDDELDQQIPQLPI